MQSCHWGACCPAAPFRTTFHTQHDTIRGTALTQSFRGHGAICGGHARAPPAHPPLSVVMRPPARLICRCAPPPAPSLPRQHQDPAGGGGGTNRGSGADAFPQTRFFLKWSQPVERDKRDTECRVPVFCSGSVWGGGGGTAAAGDFGRHGGAGGKGRRAGWVAPTKKQNNEKCGC
eukprot:gene22673-biopygen11766